MDKKDFEQDYLAVKKQSLEFMDETKCVDNKINLLNSFFNDIEKMSIGEILSYEIGGKEYDIKRRG